MNWTTKLLNKKLWTNIEGEIKCGFTGNGNMKVFNILKFYIYIIE